jgi:DNA-binding response OmpR family regulator
MEGKRILVVEDDSAIRQGIVDALKFTGYETLSARTGQDGLKKALQASFDLLLLDLILPGISGFDILKQTMEARPNLPVIILSARGQEEDRVKGLRLGADDYVVKPFSVRELLARVEAVLRRSPERPQAVSLIELSHGVADLARAEVRLNDGSRQELSDRETQLLRYLASHPDRAISRDEILLRVWRLNPARMTTRTIDMHIANLREKIGGKKNSSPVIFTVRGKGYMFSRNSQPVEAD